MNFPERPASSFHTLPLMTHEGRGKELFDLVKKELSIPDGVVEVTVTFKVKSLITVSCLYHPRNVLA